MSDEPMYTIRAISRATGLSHHLIRMWERRYSAVDPVRTGTNRRLYSDEDLERLSLLRDAVAAGHGIGQIARLPTETLRELVRTARSVSAPPAKESPSSSADDLLQRCKDAVTRLDPEGLDRGLRRAAVALSRPMLISQLIAPLMEWIGDSWAEGHVRVGQEHMASSVVRTFLGGLLEETHPAPGAPVLVTGTPAGQLHEIGALSVSLLATAWGWRAVYLGASTPATELAATSEQAGARAIALSISFPPGDPFTASELRALRACVGADYPILVGGRCSQSYLGVLQEINALPIFTVDDLRRALNGLMQGSGSP